MLKYFFFSFIFTSNVLVIANAQTTQTLHQLLQLAETNYPALKAKKFAVDAAKKAVEVSANTKIPSLDAAYQMNYATANNITGMAYPQYLMPISGPPSSSNNYSGVFGSAASLLLNWQPITFGQREAQIAFSQTGVKYASTDLANEILQHKIKVANAYLDALTYHELDKLYLQNILRTQANLSNVRTLALNGIKAGVDSTFFSTEVSKAKIDRLNIQRNKEQSIIILSQLLATSEQILIADSSYFLKLPNENLGTDSTKNPLISLYNTSIELDQAKKNAIAKTTAPTLGIWATTYSRGSGVGSNGDINTFNGLSLQRINYGLGLQLSIPILQSLKIKPQLQQQELLIKADQEKLNDITLQLDKQLQTANSTMDFALQSLKEIPILIETTKLAYTTIVSRYNAGLANYADVIQAQYNLLKAETDHKTAFMAVWKTFLYKAAVKGDINLFLNQVN